MPLNILVVGAGICGPAFATLMQRANPKHTITVLERHPTLRATGQQIDLKLQGPTIARKMGVLDTINAHRVVETGFQIENSRRQPIAHFGVSDYPDEKDRPNFLSECEIMRGDLVQTFYDASVDLSAKLDKHRGEGGGLKYEFGKTISELTQNEDGVDVTFTDGQERRFDLVVGADGQWSKTRRLAFGQAVNDQAFQSLNVFAAYYTIPHEAGDEGVARSCLVPGAKGMVTRPGKNPATTQAWLFTMKNTEHLKRLNKEPLATQKSAWIDMFKDAGWQSDRLLRGLKTSNDFYGHELAQVKMDALHKGRVVLVGDAGFCTSVFTGMGTTASLVGSYVLAGELARHGNDVGTALQGYEKTMRGPIDEWMKLSGSWSPSTMPSSRLAIWAMENVLWAVNGLGILRLMGGMGAGETKVAWKLPEYPELNLKE
ncbi:hypothetical protein BDV95DRAFT_627879 [Massariosphaeria phaeospora]|uniref:FAD-binding domain-containing protein n=1 Tax=Massariosphaeria phaeospora TaxID=100035 RepID=A0A7C8I869_9PLEO|nr:hypothetical protein BDV95DRAFT_627879 [Massariosphaeria phaeospora]